MKYDCDLEKAAEEAMGGACRQATPNPNGHNVQAYTTPNMVQIPKKDQLQDAVQKWYQPVIQHGLKDPENKFTDPHLQSFANLAHHKTTKVGCHYAKCSKPDRVVIGCMYNNPIQSNEVIYPKGTPCTKDDDCTVYNPSTCNTNTQLCRTNAKTPNNSTATTSSTATTATATATTSSPQGGGMCSNAEMTDEVRKKILDMHNWRRSQLALGRIKNGRNPYNCPTAANMYKMKYDCELEKSALDYAKQCSHKPTTRQGQGENVHSGRPKNDKVKEAKQAVQSWWNQIFQNGLNQKMTFLQNLRDKPNAPTAFTQMAWALSTKIGCAVVDCKGKTFTVCRYKEEGNVVPKQIYEVGEPCSACRTSCVGEGLCATP
ncbi:SCP-like protein [Ancylostoma caninum]|uniref:SCP-like protein n=1 Tax=Ancylostoma caninum TaxID=29170 RepID=A0A368HAJ4_ANCCA|nr:SCP-like protein [Ancylostoma caninum]